MRCFLSLRRVVNDAKKEEGESRFLDKRCRQVPSEDEREEEAIRLAIDNGETVEEAILHCSRVLFR